MVALTVQVTRFLCVVSGILLVVIAVAILADIAWRNANMPASGLHEIVEFMFTISCFFSFSYAASKGRHIQLNVLAKIRNPWVSRLLALTSASGTALIFGLIAYQATLRTYEAAVQGVFSGGTLLLPMWIPWSAMAFGSGATALAALIAALAGRNAAPRSNSSKGDGGVRTRHGC